MRVARRRTTRVLDAQGDAGRALVRGCPPQLRRARAARCVATAVATSPSWACRRPATGPSSTWAQLVEQVGHARAGLQRLGVQQGDRVAAYLPNIPETIVAFLAACSLGATWTSCAPEFGVQAVLDRFTQVEPTVLLAVEGYRYGRHTVSRVDELAAIRAGLPSLRATVVVPYPEPSALGDVVHLVGRARRASPVSSSSPRSPPTIRSTCSTRRARPGCRSRSCTATAASCSSISRCSVCTPTCGPPTASSGSPRPAG